MSRFGAAFILSTVAGSALAQSVNVDINRTTGSGAGAPAATLAGAAGQAGVWNDVAPTLAGAQSLQGLGGAASGLTVTRTGSSGSNGSSAPIGTAEYAKLMWDYSFLPTANGEVEYTVNGLDAGLYRVYTYAALPGDAGWYIDTFGLQTYYSNYVQVLLNGVNVGGGTTSGAVAPVFQQGVTHVVTNVLVGAGAPPLTIRGYTGSTNHERCGLNGFQILKVSGSRLYVDASATGAENGQSWASAFTRLQDALALAKVGQGAITEIWVANGTYTPTTLANRSATFSLVDGVKVYGGFTGNETQLEQRDPIANPVFLSGSIGAAGLADNTYHVVTALECGYATLLDGVTITSGNADGGTGNQMYGGAMWVQDSQLTVNTCKFVGNEGVRGGAVAVTNALPRFASCYFFNNTAEQIGGGMYLLSGGSANVVGCDFRVNHASINYGGALANYDGANLYVFNSRFFSNDAGFGGGAIMASSGNTLVGNCVFTGNTGDGDRGGAIHTFGANNFLFVYNSAIYGNHAFECGGVDAVSGGLAYLRNTIVWGNTDDSAATGTEAAQVKKDGAVGSTMSLVSCDIQGWTGILGGTGNIGADPMFVDPDGADNTLGTLDDNLRLALNSPCIDRGNNSSIPQDSCDIDHDNNVIEPLPLDLDMNPRRVDVVSVPDSGTGTAPFVDVGAYETENPPCYPDCNGDGALTVSDFGCFQTKFVAADPYADCNGDGVRTVADFGCFQTKFVQGCP